MRKKVSRLILPLLTAVFILHALTLSASADFGNFGGGGGSGIPGAILEGIFRGIFELIEESPVAMAILCIIAIALIILFFWAKKTGKIKVVSGKELKRERQQNLDEFKQMHSDFEYNRFLEDAKRLYV